jgi:hypothetical protein
MIFRLKEETEVQRDLLVKKEREAFTSLSFLNYVITN